MKRLIEPGCTARARQNFERVRMVALLRWIEDWTIIRELLIVWLVIVQPSLAVFWLLSERQLIRPDADRLKAVGPFGTPKISALFEATYLVGLRKAGLPD